MGKMCSGVKRKGLTQSDDVQHANKERAGIDAVLPIMERWHSGAQSDANQPLSDAIEGNLLICRQHGDHKVIKHTVPA